jgi:DNA-binding transcriptional LysR family regulator
MLDFRYLKAFKLTAKYASFSKAAQELNIAQSAVSRQIKLLENAIGVDLLIRSSKKVMLSDKGRELHQALIQFEKTSTDIFDREDNHLLNIGILEGLLKNWFTPIIADYLKSEKRDVNIQVTDLPVLKSGIEDGTYDVIFGTDNIQSELVTSLKLFEEKLVLISKSDMNKKKLKLHEYSWILYSSDDHLLKLSKERSKNIITVNSFNTIISLVHAGLGIAIVPAHLLNKEEGLFITEMPGLFASQIFMTTLNFKKMPERILALKKLVKQAK